MDKSATRNVADTIIFEFTQLPCCMSIASLHISDPEWTTCQRQSEMSPEISEERLHAVGGLCFEMQSAAQLQRWAVSNLPEFLSEMGNMIWLMRRILIQTRRKFCFLSIDFSGHLWIFFSAQFIVSSFIALFLFYLFIYLLELASYVTVLALAL